jgi:hypothetical protein
MVNEPHFGDLFKGWRGGYILRDASLLYTMV